MPYTLTQKEYVNLKRRLTRAKNSEDPAKIIDEVLYAQAIFEEKGYPDSHFDWERAYDDAQIMLRRQAMGL